MCVCVCVFNRVKMQITAASASPPKLKMSWDHEPCETDHVELQSIRAGDLEVEEKTGRCLGSFSKALVNGRVR